MAILATTSGCWIGHVTCLVAAAAMLVASGPPNTGDKLRSGARVQPRRRGHEAALLAVERCRRKLRQLHPLVRPRRSPPTSGSPPRAHHAKRTRSRPCWNHCRVARRKVARRGWLPWTRRNEGERARPSKTARKAIGPFKPAALSAAQPQPSARGGPEAPPNRAARVSVSHRLVTQTAMQSAHKRSPLATAAGSTRASFLKSAEHRG